MSRPYRKYQTLILLTIIFSTSNGQDAAIQGSSIPVPSGISVDGVPPIPASSINDIKPYLEAREAYLQDWHPLRKEMLILTRFGNTMQSHIVKMPGGMRKQITFYEEPVYQSLFDPKNGQYIISVKDMSGNEFWQIYKQDLTTGKSVLLTDGGKSFNINLLWNKKGDKLLYTSRKGMEASRNVYFVDPNNPASNQLLIHLDGLSWGIEGISNDGSKIILNGASKVWLYEVPSKQQTPLLPKNGEKGSYSARGFNSEGTGFYLLTDQGKDFNQLAYYDLETQNLEILTDFNWDIYNAYPSPDGKRVAFIVNEAGGAKAYILDTASKKHYAIGGLPTGLIYGMRWSKDSESLGFHLSTSNANSDIYEWNVKERSVIPWVQNELGGINALTIPPPRLIKWKSFDGLEISGFLYPGNNKFTGKRPVIIDIHGGPVMQAKPLFNGSNNYYTNELGIVIIYPNIRGSSGYGKTFTDMDNGLKREDALKDVGALLDWIARQPDLDAERVMVTGGSYGAYMAYRTSIEYNTKIRCTVAAFGATNLITRYNNVDSAYSATQRMEFGDPGDPQMHSYFIKTAPVNNVDKITMPIFIVQGKNDPRTPQTESAQMVEAIRREGGNVWYLLAHDEGHGFQKKNNVDYLFYATTEFIKRYLLN